MLVTIMPFACIGIGLLIGIQNLPSKIYRGVDGITTAALIVLMFTIGGNVGTNQEVIDKIGIVGINCLVTSLMAISGSVAFAFIVEKTILPLSRYNTLQIDDEDGIAKELPKNEDSVSPEKRLKIDPILIIIPASLLTGAFGCYYFMSPAKTFILDYSLWIALIILYTSVGIGMGQNKNVFKYIKVIGFRIFYLVAAILTGSMLGGAAASLITNIPFKYALASASGVSYYSMTGATMLSAFGTEAGVYGFMINVFREFFTVMLLPVLRYISKSAPIAAGAAGNMDTMLVPITRVMGKELGLVALIVGVILTFSVPVILPVLCNMLV